MPTFLQNISSDIFTTSNRFKPLDQTSDEEDSTLPSIFSPSSFWPAPFATSSPKDNYRSLRNTARELKVISVNCDSMQSLGKRAELQAIIENHNPHIILGQESKLGSEHELS